MRRAATLLALILGLSLLTSGCLFFPAAVRNAAHQPQPVPWWCNSDVGSALSTATCGTLSGQLDFTLDFALAHRTAGDAVTGGATGSAYEQGVGAAFRFSAATASFDAKHPDTLLYDGVDNDAQIVGVEFNVAAADAPAGFDGGNDVWTDMGDGTWRLRAWIVRPFENENNPFAETHPCLGETEATYDVTAECFTDTHPLPLQILVTNDDGYNSAGIDAITEALRVIPGVEVTVVAPATNQSGTGDKTTPGGVTADDGLTLSGYAAKKVNGFPADSVLYALNVLGENPDLVVSGINNGQNIGPLAGISGTVGAARTAGRLGIPAVAASQGLGNPPDYPSGVTAVLDWVADFRLGRAGAPFQQVASINIPTCTSGAIRGTLEVPTATAFNNRPFNPSDCTSSVTTINDDIDAFLNGYISLSDVHLH
jgi:5'-nucleotidase